MTDADLRRQLDEARAEVARLREQLEIAREFGRFGLWEREIPSGRGRWDPQVFRMYGLEPADEAPDLEYVLSLLHPEDAAQRLYHASTREPGVYQRRVRIVGAGGGEPRWVRIQWVVKAGADGAPARALGIAVDDTEAIEMVRSLDAASAQLKLAVDLGNIAIWRHDLRSNRMYYNDRAFAVLGIAPRPEGMSIDEVRALIHPDDLPHVLESAKQALVSDGPTDMEARYRRSDGTWRYVLTRRVAQRDASGQALAFVGVALDVTEQVEKQREAARLAQRIEALAAAAGVGVWRVNVDTGERQWNRQMFAIAGRDPTAGQPTRHEFWNQIVHPADREALWHHRNLVVEGDGSVREQAYRIIRPDGQVRWLIDRARREVVDGANELLVVTLDLTDQRQIEAALSEASERAALAARGAGIGTWSFDVVTEQAQWDEQMWRLRGLQPRPGALNAAERLALVHPDDRARVERLMDLRQTAPGAFNAEFRVVWPDGQVRWLATRSLAVREADGRLVRLVGVNWDVTEARNAEAARQEKQLAERASRAKSQFLARMSHELRTPLNAVLGFTQLLERERGMPIGDSQLDKLRHIRRAGKHLLALIDDVLDLTRLETGQLELDSAPLPLDAIVADALPLVAPLAERTQVSLGRPPASALHAHADRKRLLQVLLNLLSNAVKYNRRGGRVDVSFARRDGRAWIEVADSGRGLDAEELAHLFEPFNRLHAEREGIEGTGIGLVIVKALVERMGGVIEVRSERDVGTTFAVGLPEADATAAEAPATVPAELTMPAMLAGSRLLYIEDNPVNVTLVEEIVRGMPSIDFASAASGLAGIERARSMLPQLILLDMQLPDIDGAEVLARLRQDELTAGIPCIAVSANAMPEDIARALQLGFIDYWTKPIDVARFRAALAKRFSQ